MEFILYCWKKTVEVHGYDAYNMFSHFYCYLCGNVSIIVLETELLLEPFSNTPT